MIIAVDAAGGDYYPKNPVLGALEATREFNQSHSIVIGPEKLVKQELSQHSYDTSRIQIFDSPRGG